MGNIVAIVGRPNVGKSTLFNRLTGKRQAIVDEYSGVTRDRHYGKVEWNGLEFSIVDTGGYIVNSDDIFEEAIRSQVQIAIDEADVVYFVVDVKVGITDLDEQMAKILRKKKKKVIVITNKVDTNNEVFDADNFYSLGFDNLFKVSSVNGSGTGDLLDETLKLFEKIQPEEEEIDLPRIAVVGRPNAGKSSLVNALIGEERNIVTPISGTTRDSIDTVFNKYGFNFILVDTAGIRKKQKVTEDLEFYSVMRAFRAIEHSDVCLLMLDATLGMEAQDVNIYGTIERNKKGIVILVNKWDLAEKETNSVKDYSAAIRERIAPNSDVPIIFTSALTKQRIHKVLETAIEVYNNKNQKISTSELNDYFQPILEQFPPPSVKDKFIKIKYVTQLPTAVPTFAFYANLPNYIKEPYRRFLENKIREKYRFTGVPIRIYFRQK
ncbi:MAG: ribosome biogenesis GTPase Der [Bacteroidales bacterium]|nr:ribosome biogenesis GTPase Der [Bacteroidales bacterium]